MSRRIDISDPSQLSDEDRKYLRSRGRINVVNHLDYMAKVNAAADAKRGPDRKTEEVDEPYTEWSVSDLRNEARLRRLDTTGNKADLVRRLEAHDANS